MMAGTKLTERFEYTERDTTSSTKIIGLMDALGNDGWEVVSVLKLDGGWFGPTWSVYAKRRTALTDTEKPHE